MIKELQLTNFAAFKELKLDFSSKINVIIGENSCGKTQILKSIHALTNDDVNDSENLFSLFKPHKETLSALYHRAGSADAELLIKDANDKESKIAFTSTSRSQLSETAEDANARCLLIPTKEILSLLPAINSGKVNGDGLKALFDKSVIDLCNQVLKSPSKDTNKLLNRDPRAAELAPMLAKALGGKFMVEGTEQYFVTGSYREQKPQGSSQSKHAKVYADYTELKFDKSEGTETSVTMTAEGYRKVGLLQRLLENGTLTQSGVTTVLWDEPESNMNPSLIRMLVECLLTLSRNGQQVIVATHNYVLLKWFDLLVDSKKGDHIMFHALYRDENKVIRSESKADYKMLSENAIADTYGELYDQEVTKALG
jgi:predicted ATP-dependent endonuclease of OLD family